MSKPVILSPKPEHPFLRNPKPFASSIREPGVEAGAPCPGGGAVPDPLVERAPPAASLGARVLSGWSLLVSSGCCSVAVGPGQGVRYGQVAALLAAAAAGLPSEAAPSGRGGVCKAAWDLTPAPIGPPWWSGLAPMFFCGTCFLQRKAAQKLIHLPVVFSLSVWFLRLRKFRSILLLSFSTFQKSNQLSGSAERGFVWHLPAVSPPGCPKNMCNGRWVVSEETQNGNDS